MEVIWLAIITGLVAIFTTTVTPLLIARQANKRLDRVAELQAKATEAQNKCNRATLARLDETKALSIGIHTLTNNAYTEAKKATLEAKKFHRMTLEGQEENDKNNKLIKSLSDEIQTLEAEIATRDREGHVADAQIEAGSKPLEEYGD